MASTVKNKAEVEVVRLEELSWIEAPGHHGALSKLLVNPENSAAKYFDFLGRCGGFTAAGMAGRRSNSRRTKPR
jgi:hypothetical protein